MLNSIRIKGLLTGLATLFVIIMLAFSLSSCRSLLYKEEMEPWTGTITGEARDDYWDIWSICVEDKDGKVEEFSYDIAGVATKAWDSAFNVGDKIAIKRYSDGSYSFPSKFVKNEK
jgi:hypothetical protein